MFLLDDTLHKLEGFHAIGTLLVLQQQQNLGERLVTSEMHLSLLPPVTKVVVHSEAVALLLLIFCLLLLPLW